MTHAIAQAFAGVDRAKSQIDALADRIGAEGVLIGDTNMTDLVHRLGTVLDIAGDYLDTIAGVIGEAKNSYNDELRAEAFAFCKLIYPNGQFEDPDDELKTLLDILFGKREPTDEPASPSFADGGFVSDAANKTAIFGEVPSEHVIDPSRIKANTIRHPSVGFTVNVAGQSADEIIKQVSDKLNDALKTLITSDAQPKTGKATMPSLAVAKAIDELKEQVGVAPAPNDDSAVTSDMPPEIAAIVKQLQASGNTVIVTRLR